LPIQILSELVAAQIAAGEVVERPASVVKELVENALDAGATLIQVESEGGGRKLIAVTDNGSGIPADEVELAFVRHATSKLTTVDDLYQIQTLGFRGEALASIASVSQMTVLTRTEAEATGTLVRMRAGQVIERRAAGTPAGTVFTVENLFFNTPARLKFLKAETTERRHIDQIIARYATAYPNVRFMLKQDGRLVFQTTGNGSLADVLVEVLGLDVMRDMLEVTPAENRRPDLPPISVVGFTGAPHLNRNTRTHIQLFVNGRAIQDSSLAYAVIQAYHTYMPSDRFPVAVLLINLPPEEVDVNVHPTKAEVRFRTPDAVFSAVQAAVRKAVVQGAPIASSSARVFQDAENIGDAAPTNDNTPREYTPTPFNDPRRAVQYSFGDSVRESGFRPQQMPTSYPKREPSAYTPEPQETPANSLRDTNYAYPRPIVTPPPYATGQAARKIPPMRVVGQVAATYIIAEGPAGMYLIDQHAAHERILFEQFMAEHAAKPQVNQRTLNGIEIQVSAASYSLISENQAMLAALGFEVSPASGENTLRVETVPALLANQPPEETLRLILGDLESGAEPGASTVEAKILLRVCKAAAVKAGQILSYSEMQQMIRMLEQCQNPRTCPHGRPTMIHLSSDQLAKEFGRM
jgi:DNA mismatch repair protein MutL